MTLWTKKGLEELRLNAIASMERQIDQLHDFVDTLDITNNEVHKTVMLTLMPSIIQLQRDLNTMKSQEEQP